MEVYNGKIAVTFDELTSDKEGEAVMSKSTLSMTLHRHPELRLTRGGGLDCICRIDYYRLRESYRRKFEAKYGDPRKKLAEEALRAELDLMIDETARKYYLDYRYEKRGELVALPDKVIDELTLNASVLNRMIEITNRRSAMRNARGRNSSVKEILESAGEMYEKLRDAYGHTLPASLERLRTKMTAYKLDGYITLISGKWGNSSATVITEEAGRYIIALKRSKVPVYTDGMILELFNIQGESRGWKPLRSLRALRDWLNRPEVLPLWYDAAHGELASAQKFKRQHRTMLPEVRDALWYGDGTKLNLYYKEWVPNNNGGGKWEVRTLQVYEVIDAYSEVMLGYSISETEGHKAQYAAYRMAVMTAGHRPYELVHDNQGGHKKLKTMGFLDKLPSGVHRTTAPNNGQSKTIESLFNRFQDGVLRQNWRFTGMNITASKMSSRVNLEFIAANAEFLYTRDELIAGYAEARKQWNEAPHYKTGKSHIEMYRQSVNPAAPAVTEVDMVNMFWLTTDRPIAYTGDGLMLTVDGRKHYYEVYEAPRVPDHEFLRQNFGRQYYVKYDPCDMSSVRLYTKDAKGLRFARVADKKIEIHRDILSQTKADREFIRAEQEANKRDRMLRQIEVRQIELEHGVTPEQQGLNRPKMSGMSKKEMDEIDRQTYRRVSKIRREAKAPIPYTPAQIGKMISQKVFDPEKPATDFDPLSSQTEYSEMRAVGKL